MVALSLCPHGAGRENQRMRERGGEEEGERVCVSSGVSYKGTNPVTRTPHHDLSNPNYFKGPISKYCYIGVKSSIYEFRGSVGGSK